MGTYWDVQDAGWVVRTGPPDALVTPWSPPRPRAVRPVRPDAVLLRRPRVEVPAQRSPVRSRTAAVGS